jgi:DNA modification methylase
MELNKVYLGDAYKMIKDIPDKSVDCIYTDIPYLYESGGSGNSELSKRIETMKNEIRSANIYDGINYDILNDFLRISRKINIFIWCSRLQLLDLMNFFIPKGFQFRILTWHKTNPTPSTNNSWLPDTEYCLYFKDNTFSLNDGYELKSQYYISPINKKDKDLYNHPTIKPLELVKRHLLHTTQENDVIFDPFLGSGTTAVACKETKRNYIGFEDNEEYYKTSLDRLNNITQIDRKMKDNGILDIFDFLDE